MYEGISLRVPAKESALTVVRLTTAGAAAQGCPDFETLEDFKTAVYEACYAMTKQKVTPEELLIEYAPGEVFSVSVRGCGARRETGGRRWTLLAMVLPTAVGMAVCMLIHGAFGLLG